MIFTRTCFNETGDTCMNPQVFNCNQEPQFVIGFCGRNIGSKNGLAYVKICLAGKKESALICLQGKMWGSTSQCDTRAEGDDVI